MFRFKGHEYIIQWLWYYIIFSLHSFMYVSFNGRATAIRMTQHVAIPGKHLSSPPALSSSTPLFHLFYKLEPLLK